MKMKKTTAKTTTPTDQLRDRCQSHFLTLRIPVEPAALDELLARPSPPATPPRPGTEDASVIAAALWHTVRANSAANANRTSSAEPSRWKLEGRRQQLDRTP